MPNQSFKSLLSFPSKFDTKPEEEDLILIEFPELGFDIELPANTSQEDITLIDKTRGQGIAELQRVLEEVSDKQTKTSKSLEQVTHPFETSPLPLTQQLPREKVEPVPPGIPKPTSILDIIKQNKEQAKPSEIPGVTAPPPKLSNLLPPEAQQNILEQESDLDNLWSTVTTISDHIIDIPQRGVKGFIGAAPLQLIAGSEIVSHAIGLTSEPGMAKASRQWLEKALPTADTSDLGTINNFLLSTLPEAAGGMASYLLTAVGVAASLPATVPAAATIGAGVTLARAAALASRAKSVQKVMYAIGGWLGLEEGWETIQDQERAGQKVQLGQKLLTMSLATGKGASEMIPIYNSLNRITKGFTGKSRDNFFSNLNKKEGPLNFAIANSIEETFQETLSTYGWNAYRKEVLDLEQNVMDGVLSGGAAGAILGFAMGGLGGVVRRNQFRQRDADESAKIASEVSRITQSIESKEQEIIDQTSAVNTPREQWSEEQVFEFESLASTNEELRDLHQQRESLLINQKDIASRDIERLAAPAYLGKNFLTKQMELPLELKDTPRDKAFREQFSDIQQGKMDSSLKPIIEGFHGRQVLEKVKGNKGATQAVLQGNKLLADSQEFLLQIKLKLEGEKARDKARVPTGIEPVDKPDIEREFKDPFEYLEGETALAKTEEGKHIWINPDPLLDPSGERVPLKVTHKNVDELYKNIVQALIPESRTLEEVPKSLEEYREKVLRGEAEPSLAKIMVPSLMKENLLLTEGTPIREDQNRGENIPEWMINSIDTSKVISLTAPTPEVAAQKYVYKKIANSVAKENKENLDPILEKLGENKENYTDEISEKHSEETKELEKELEIMKDGDDYDIVIIKSLLDPKYVGQFNPKKIVRALRQSLAVTSRKGFKEKGLESLAVPETETSEKQIDDQKNRVDKALLTLYKQLGDIKKGKTNCI